MLGAEAFSDREKAAELFGFDIRGAGLLPIQIIFDNKSDQPAQIVAGQTFLVDSRGNYWKLLSNRDAVLRVEEATKKGEIASGAGKGAGIGASIGALLGLAIGVVSGENIGEAALKGGVLGGAGGAVIGGVEKGSNTGRREFEIADDLADKGIEGKTIAKESMADGFIFFPGEASSATELRLQLKFIYSGDVRTITLKVQ